MKKIKEYLELFFVFFKIGAVTFGGGLVMLPILERDLIKKRDWMTSEQLVDYFAIGQSSPGIIAVNVATFVGYNRKKILGSIVSTMGIVCPSLIIITLLAMFLNSFSEIIWVQSAMKGINVVVAVLLISAVFSLGKKTLIDWITIFIALLAFFAMVVFNVPGIFIVLASSVIGVLVNIKKINLNSKNKEKIK